MDVLSCLLFIEHDNFITLFHKKIDMGVLFVSGEYPIGHPIILNGSFDWTFQSYFGMAKCTMLPPKKLYHPVLPARINGKLIFALCRTCAENENHHDRCQCSDSARAFTGVWPTPEILKSIEMGYTVQNIQQVREWVT